MPIDQTDRLILAELSKNARISNKELARAANLSPSSTHERVKRLTQDGLIAGAHIEAPLERLGLALRALLFVQMAEHEKTRLDSFIRLALEEPEVRAAWMITGRFDAVVEIVARDTTHLHRVVVEKFSSREEISRIETSVVFERRTRRDLTAALALTGPDQT